MFTKKSSILKNSTTLIATLLVIAISLPINMVMADPVAPQTSAKKKRFVIDYADYNKVLKGLVLVKRGTSRKPKQQATPPTGTRISWVNKKITRYESNRVMFHMLKDEHKEFIRFTRQSLEAIPTEFPLELFDKDEQLAYWLNLRNLAVMESVMDIYPRMRLKRPYTVYTKDKRLTIAGTKMSINDIEALVLKQWPNPDVIYGFYDGTVGGPNIRKRAFEGRFVWDDLRKNAREFTNSVKGIQFSRKTAKLSEFYQRYPSLFPNLKDDVVTHMSKHLRSDLHEKLQQSKKVKFDVDDWSIADLMNGRMGLSSPGSISPAALVTARISSGSGGPSDFVTASAQMRNSLTNSGVSTMEYMSYPAHVRTYLHGMRERMRDALDEMDSSIITIDEKGTAESATEKASKKEKKKKKKDQ